LENILLTRSTGVKLCDFGLAAITFDGIVKGGCGSFEYSAPEVIASPSCNGFKADMWSVGIVIYALFARGLPFRCVTKEFDFATADVDYSPIPRDIQPLVRALLSLDPEARPHATEARGFPALNSRQVNRKEPLSAVPDELDFTDCDDLVCRLSQIFRAPFDELFSILRRPGRRIEKVIFELAKKKLAVMNAHPLFRSDRRSLPQTPSTSMTIRQSFLATSADLFKELHSVLMKQRCCVSSPIVPEPVIVPMKDPSDVRIGFSCVDDVHNKQSVLTLVLHQDKDEFAREIIEQMRACIPPAA
jgi:serine/threonine protein kinase